MTPTDETTNLTTSPWSHSLSGFGIHRIDASRKIFTQCKIAKEIVSLVVEEYKKTTKGTFISPELQEWDYHNHFNFRLKIFCFKKQSPNHFGIFLNNLGAQENFGEISYYFVCFIYRDTLPPSQEPVDNKKKWDIFALTLGDGWRVVKAFSDYMFPIKIALRVVDPNLSVVESKPLAGHKEASTETYRQAYCLEPHELDTLWHIFKQFKAGFKMKSSMFTLDPFKGDERVGVEIGRGKILIIKRIPFDQMPIILNHFAKIYRGEKTHKEDDSEETDDPSFKYLQNISPVDEDTSEQLNNRIIELIYECLKDAKRTLNFSFIHKYYKTFFSSHSFKLVFGEWEETWNYPPDMYQILATLRVMLKSSPLQSSQQLAGLLEKMHFKFGTTQQKHLLLEFFEGELHQKEKTYFRNEGVWLTVRPSHLVVLQHDFHTLLNSCLIKNLEPSKSEPGALPISWIAKEEWAAFTVQQALNKGISQKDLEIALQPLQNTVFSFVEDGHVKVKTPTFCLLKEASNSLAKTIEKKWAELRELLSYKASKKEKLLVKDLEVLFPNKKDDDDEDQKKDMQSTAKKVYNLLTKKRPICAPPSNGQTKKAPKERILTATGDVRLRDISNCAFKSKALRDHREWVEKQLEKEQVNKEAFINELASKKFKETENGNAHKISVANAEKAFTELTEPVSLNTTLRGLFCIRAPINQTTLGSNSKVYKFLDEQHQNYTRICKEEGYNRAYLEKKGFIVGDQLYANKREKVELFDILYHDKSEGKLYLYHVKEEFGQPTRAACAQIRVAAHSLAAEIASGSFTMLKQFYANCINSRSTTIFREHVKKQFSDLSPDNPDDPEGFIGLFRNTCPKNIIFVYAFIDTSPKERRLEDEENPIYIFSGKDFEPQTLDILKSHNYLNEEGKITEKLLRSTKKQFIETVKIDDAKEVFFKLNRQISQFDSMSAKVELLHLRDDLMHKNPTYPFGFKICQIRRDGNFDDAEIAVEADVEIKNQPQKSTISAFEYNSQTFEVDENPATSLAIMKEIMGVSLQMPDYEFKYFFEMRLRQQPKDKLESLLKEKKIEGDTFEDRLNTYVEKTIKLSSFAEIDFKIAASITGIHLVSLETIDDEEEGFVIDKTTRKEITPQGGRVCCVIEHNNGKFLTHSTEKISYIDCINDEDIISLFRNSPEPVGIFNPDATYCFLNSALQLIFHTPLFKSLVSKAKLAIENSDLDTQNSELQEKEKKARLQFYEALRKFGLEYYLTENKKESCQTPEHLRSALSDLVIDEPTRLKDGQQDAAEVFDLLFKCYNLTNYQFTITVNQLIDRSTEVRLREGDLTKYSQITKENTLPNPSEKPYVLQLPIPNGSSAISFQDCLNSYLKDEKLPDKVKYLDGEILYEGQPSISREIIRLPEAGLLMSFKRFDNELKKIATPIVFERTEIKINNKAYQLSFFIEHRGDTMKSGHYVAYGKIKDKWFLFDDGAAPKEKSHEEILDHEKILDCVKRAYILHFQ